MNLCVFEGCSKQSFKAGLCSGHYQQKQKGKELKPLQVRLKKGDPRPKVCSFEGCGRKNYHNTLILCRQHYVQKIEGKELSPLRFRTPSAQLTERCTVLGCNKTSYQSNLCRGHVQQRWEGKDISPLREKVVQLPMVCIVKSCNKDAKSKNLCANHYSLSSTYKIKPSHLVELIDTYKSCQICGTVTEKLTIDHDHSCCSGSRSCGKCIRGILCIICNSTLGRFNDDPSAIMKMVEYLHRPHLNFND